MKKNNFIGACFKFYTKKGQRVSAFCEILGCQLTITTFYCSKQDLHKFDKKFSWKIWNEHEGKELRVIKEEFGVTLHQNTIEVDPKFARKEFIEWLRYNFYLHGPVPCIINQLVPAIELNYYQIISQGLKKK